jgi:hypothetical protein
VPTIINASQSPSNNSEEPINIVKPINVLDKTLIAANVIGHAANFSMVASIANRYCGDFLPYPKNFINFKKTPPINLAKSEKLLSLVAPIAASITNNKKLKDSSQKFAQVLYRGGQGITAFNAFVFGTWALKTAYNGNWISKATFGTAGILLCGAGTIAAGKTILPVAYQRAIYHKFGGITK